MEHTVNTDAELSLWKERYRALFERNLAAIVITTPAGRMMDCNEAFTQMAGFDSRAEVLARSAWDFYFDPGDRDAVISQSEVLENHTGQELRLRQRNGTPRWVKVTRVVISRDHDRPELLQGTLIAVSYTHLDVYKRQTLTHRGVPFRCRKRSSWPVWFSKTSD